MDTQQFIEDMLPSIRDTEEYKSMSSYNACAIAEGFSGEEPTITETAAAWQYLLDTGLCFQLQGWYGRTATSLLESGMLLPVN